MGTSVCFQFVGSPITIWQQYDGTNENNYILLSVFQQRLPRCKYDCNPKEQRPPVADSKGMTQFVDLVRSVYGGNSVYIGTQDGNQPKESANSWFVLCPTTGAVVESDDICGAPVDLLERLVSQTRLDKIVAEYL